MLIDHDAAAGTVRVDEEGLRALLAARRGEVVPEASAALEAAEGLDADLGAVTDPLVSLGLVVAGPTARLEHRIWVDAERAVAVAEVRPGTSQLLVLPPAHLAAALARLARLRPRRTGERAERRWHDERLPELVAADPTVRAAALAEAGAGHAWQLVVDWAGEERRLVGVDGEDGPFLADPEAGVLRPTSNTVLYRLFATVLPPAALPEDG
jgi:hypothetical protein